MALDFYGKGHHKLVIIKVMAFSSAWRNDATIQQCVPPSLTVRLLSVSRTSLTLTERLITSSRSQGMQDGDHTLIPYVKN